ncbi:MAG TPA: peptidase M16 [Sulfurospirillum sp. UBA11407]|jgi:predicted Zn-dependent peptidase|nr:MAG TPA: peptidase M16 [Sulfurospirillum sp. UBA11407]DAB33273.1 MAG TPA: peptidase M16 [Sulfurospirillum sp. UBA12182]
MKKLIFMLMLIQGVLVSSVIDKVKIDGIEVPIIYEKNSHLPLFSFQLVVKSAGSIYDGELAGLAKFSANMLGEGTKQKGSIKFAQELEFHAINLSVHSGTETFVFEISALKEQYDFALQMLKELLNDPNFTEQSFEKIKQVTLGSLSSKQSDFDYIANLNLKKEIFKGTPIGHAFSGEVQSIEKLKLQDIEDFYKNYVDLSNMIVVVGGDVALDEVKSSLITLLSGFRKNQERNLPYFEVAKDAQDVEVEKPSEQAYIYFGAPYNVKAEDKDTYKSKVAGFILGESGFGSRLMEEIRVKRGLAYSAYSRMNINKSNSYFSGYLQTKNENLEDAKKIVKEEIERFVNFGVTKEELEQAKKFLLGSEPLRNETLSQRLSRAFSEYYRGYELGFSKKQLELIESLSLEELNAFINAHKEITNLTFSVVTNRSEK